MASSGACQGCNSIVQLNVGGTCYSSTLTTLTRYQDSMLSSMFSGQWKVARDDQGRCFIDRDGSLFSYVLNFLRDSTLELPSDFSQFGQLMKEAEFYQIQPLIEAIQRERKRRSNHIYLYHNTDVRQYRMEGPSADVSSFGHRRKMWHSADGEQRAEVGIDGTEPITDIIDSLASSGYVLTHTSTSTTRKVMYCEYILRRHS
eukprot:gb/GFBE01077431.1/.p1 GENE.gb/GFBE01077431.1/~~gb/GFBE01077431.1/.p1  ORF type:complete len:202 (+),score=24.43 gb/GFBE01077431.1/:1-606(+)